MIPTITPNFKKRVLEEVKDALCLGISLVTGPMIRETVDIAKSVKAWNPEFPVILGGWHPSLLPKQTLECEWIDIVVRGQGEDSLLELVQHIETRSAIDSVTRIGFKRNDKLIFTPERPLKPVGGYATQGLSTCRLRCVRTQLRTALGDVHQQPGMPVRLRVLHQRGRLRTQMECASAGAVCRGNSRSYRRYSLEMLWVVDDNFLVDLDRARLIGEGLVRAGANFKWSIQATTNLTARLTLEDLKLLRRGGLHQICQGVDSGSEKILKLMNKTFQDFDSIYQSAERCLEADIRPSFNIIFAYPGEGDKERRETINFMMDVCRRFPGAEFWTNIFTPYPGSPIMRQAKELGIEVPSSLEGWADFFPRYTVLPWLKGKDHTRLQVMRDYLRIAFDRIPIAADNRDRLTRPVRRHLDSRRAGVSTTTCMPLPWSCGSTTS